ncbi:MAG: hypothetical protein IJC61_05500 [Oscillospiraceae bacterium]|nr:hypothetical protein [Oscillospiraceae bacterium]
MKTGGIAEKWFYVTLLPTLATVLIACFFIFFVSRQNYYFSAEQAIGFRIRSVQDAFPETALSQQERYRSLVSLVEEFTEKNRFEFMVLDNGGDVLVTSSGFAYSSDTTKTDLIAARTNENGRNTFIGRTENGERIIAVTQLLEDGYGDAAAIRFVSSLANIDAQVRQMLNVSLIFGAALLALVFVTGTVFVNSMVQPLAKIDSTARQIAAGARDERIDNTYSG